MTTINYTGVSKFSQSIDYDSAVLIVTTNEVPTGEYSFIGGNNNVPSSFLQGFILNNENSLLNNFFMLYEEKRENIINQLNNDLEKTQPYKVNSLPRLIDENGVINGEFMQFITNYSTHLNNEIGEKTFEPDDNVYLTIKLQFLNCDGLTYTSPYLLSLKFTIV